MKRYRGKYSRKARMPLASWLMILLAVLSLSTGTVVAYLAASTNPVQNTFKAETQLDPAVTEVFDGTVKSDVKVKVGDPGYSVYVRAAIVITWKDANGNVLPQIPVEGTDYNLVMPNPSGWTKHSDGYYYYNTPVVSGGITTNLIDSCTRTDTPDPVSGYTLSVDIITQTIQALGTTDDGSKTPIQDAWKTP